MKLDSKQRLLLVFSRKEQHLACVVRQNLPLEERQEKHRLRFAAVKHHCEMLVGLQEKMPRH